MSTTEEKLLKARDIIKSGWTQNKYYTEGRRRYCALGAIGAAWEVDPAYIGDCIQNLQVEVSLVAKHLAAVLGETQWNVCIPHYPGCAVAGMNDNPTTKKQDVIQAFEKAAAEAAEKGL